MNRAKIQPRTSKLRPIFNFFYKYCYFSFPTVGGGDVGDLYVFGTDVFFPNPKSLDLFPLLDAVEVFGEDEAGLVAELGDCSPAAGGGKPPRLPLLSFLPPLKI